VTFAPSCIRVPAKGLGKDNIKTHKLSFVSVKKKELLQLRIGIAAVLWYLHVAVRNVWCCTHWREPVIR
jgi:hypothetical protein